MTAVPLRPVRRWISRTRAEHRDRGETLGSVYVGVLCVLIAGAMFQEKLAAFFWPRSPSLSGPAAVVAAVLLGASLLLALRSLGPVTLSRPAASFLLTAPVSKRLLLLPAVRLTAIAAAVTAAAAAFGVLGHTSGRDSLPRSALGAAATLAGCGLFLIAVRAQAHRGLARLTDRVAGATVAVALAALIAEATGHPLPGPPVRPAACWVAGVAVTLAVVVAAAFLVTVRGLARVPNNEILESAKTTGTLFDAAFGMEPTWVTDMVERRYWANRRIRSSRLPARLPVLVGQDLRLARRRWPRLVRLAGATALPLLFTAAAGWVIGVVVLLGAMTAAATTIATVRTDAGNPVLLRLLGLSSRRALAQRLAVPTVLGAVWTTTALALLTLAGVLPSGPWPLLGPSLGLVGAVAAVRRARVGFVRNDLLPLETPMGTVSTGPLVSSVAGADVLLLALPAVLTLATGTTLSLTLVAGQTIVATLGAHLYHHVSTARDRVELTGR